MLPRTNTYVLTAIGMMSGTSFDGIDAAIIRSNGDKIHDIGATASVKYTPSFREKIRLLLLEQVNIKALLEVSNEIAAQHAHLVHDLLKSASLTDRDIDIIGFHGQAIYHDPANGQTMQIGNASLLAKMTGIDIVSDFRSMDIAHGGQGAPLVPLFHQALFSDNKKPIAVLNIGGVSNITYLGASPKEILAFDTGPGCALIDDFVLKNFGQNFDDQGKIARSGKPDEHLLAELIADPYFDKAPPKSLNRDHFQAAANKVKNLSKEDALATLTHFTADAIAKSAKFLPSPPLEWLVCGGGRNNKFLLEILKTKHKLNVTEIKYGDFIEAQAFGFLAIRSFYQMPLSLPSTTGTRFPVSGGALTKYHF